MNDLDLDVFCQQFRDSLRYRIAHGPENCQPFIIRSLGFGRVRETQVDAFPLSQPDRAVFTRIVANSNDQVKNFIPELVGVFGLATMCDANLVQHLDCFGMHLPRRFGPGRECPPIV